MIDYSLRSALGFCRRSSYIVESSIICHDVAQTRQSSSKVSRFFVRPKGLVQLVAPRVTCLRLGDYCYRNICLCLMSVFENKFSAIISQIQQSSILIASPLVTSRLLPPFKDLGWLSIESRGRLVVALYWVCGSGRDLLYRLLEWINCYGVAFISQKIVSLF